MKNKLYKLFPYITLTLGILSVLCFFLPFVSYYNYSELYNVENNAIYSGFVLAFGGESVNYITLSSGEIVNSEQPLCSYRIYIALFTLICLIYSTCLTIVDIIAKGNNIFKQFSGFVLTLGFIPMLVIYESFMYVNEYTIYSDRFSVGYGLIIMGVLYGLTLIIKIIEFIKEYKYGEKK